MTGSEQKKERFEAYEDALCAFSLSTGVCSRIVDAHGNILFSSQADGSVCEVCRIVQEATGRRHDCGRHFLYGYLQAERFGGRYVYYCPSGMTYFTAMLYTSVEEQYCLSGGPVLMADKEDYLAFDIDPAGELPEECLNRVRALLEQVKTCSPERVTALSKTLTFTASYLSGRDSLALLDKERGAILQSRISEAVQDIKDAAEEDDGYPFGKEQELLESISEGDRETAGRLLNEILGYVFFSSGGNFSIIKTRVTELVVLLSRSVLTSGALEQDVFYLNGRYLEELAGIHNLDRLTEWLSGILSRFNEITFTLSDVKHSDTIYRVIGYIKKNYMNRLTIDDIAAHVHFSPSYLSRIFKAEFRTSLNAYLNQVRIGKSKALLLTETIPLSEIPYLVGYEDQSYFSKVFKKLTGVSPGRFRETRGQSISGGQEPLLDYKDTGQK